MKTTTKDTSDLDNGVSFTETEFESLKNRIDISNDIC